MPKALAHRGDSFHFPENTEISFAAAIKLGVDVIETDVHLTSDGEILIWHDENFSRISGDSRKIREIHSRELEEIDAGAFFTRDGGKTYPFRRQGIHPLLLKDALSRFPGTRFNIDLKDNNPELAEACSELFQKSRSEARVCIGSFHHKVLESFRNTAGRVETSISRKELKKQLGIYRFGGSIPVIRKGISRVIQMPEYHKGIKLLTPGLIRWAKKRDVIIQIWTVNEPARMEKLFKMGVDGIFSDDAESVVKVAAAYSILAPPRQISPS